MSLEDKTYADVSQYSLENKVTIKNQETLVLYKLISVTAPLISSPY